MLAADHLPTENKRGNCVLRCTRVPIDAKCKCQIGNIGISKMQIHGQAQARRAPLLPRKTWVPSIRSHPPNRAYASLYCYYLVLYLGITMLAEASSYKLQIVQNAEPVITILKSGRVSEYIKFTFWLKLTEDISRMKYTQCSIAVALSVRNSIIVFFFSFGALYRHQSIETALFSTPYVPFILLW